jgi:hypothetical protein
VGLLLGVQQPNGTMLPAPLTALLVVALALGWRARLRRRT